MNTPNDTQEINPNEPGDEIRKLVQDTFTAVDRSIAKLRLTREEHAELSGTLYASFQGLGTNVLRSTEQSIQRITSEHQRTELRLNSILADRDQTIETLRQENTVLSRRAPADSEA